MENKKNAGVEGIKIHDVVLVSKHCQVGEAGEKKGRSWYETQKIGVVMSVTTDGFKMLEPNMDELEYDANEDNSEYYHTISQASDIAYERAIVKAITEQKKKVDSENETMAELETWHKTFKHQISLFGQIARFVKGSLAE